MPIPQPFNCTSQRDKTVKLPPLSLIPMSPHCPGGGDAALRYCATLADILYADAGQPAEIKGPPGTAAMTPEAILAYNDEWCRNHQAVMYAVIADDGFAGTITLGHIDEEQKSASCGWILHSRHRDRGTDDAAFVRIKDIARQKGIATLRARVTEDGDCARFWKRHGARFTPEGRPGWVIGAIDI
jgi:hypothetical protein